MRHQILISILFCSFFQPLEARQNLLRLSSGQEVFASGMNLAWIHFGRDLTDFNEKEMTRALDEVSTAGGNTLRWWLHVNGSASPRFENGKVSGLNDSEIPALKSALDLAEQRGMVFVLCLWSFDMLQKQSGVDLSRNAGIVEETHNTQLYINNALIPLVRGVKGHPAILCWEICNEPEGMSKRWGWTPRKTTMANIQRFHNQIAGAIHRESPDALVTTGSWNMQVMCDRGDFHNFYSDAELIAAGGDTLGTLDFYQVHYYPRWYGEDHSPFHHPAEYWDLDKPILIGEFQAKGLFDIGKGGYRPKSTLSTEEAYMYAMKNGYAGCLGWTWTGHDGFGNVEDAAPGMKRLKDDHPDKIIIQVPEP